MCEILFEGKRTDNGEWVYGSLLDYRPHYDWTVIYHLMDNDDGMLEMFSHDVNPSTVGRYTGLKDKNNKRIFEGDIVRLYDMHNLKVTFNEGCFYVEDEIVCVPVFTYDTAAYKIIGNIHDNPELLEVDH